MRITLINMDYFYHATFFVVTLLSIFLIVSELLDRENKSIETTKNIDQTHLRLFQHYTKQYKKSYDDSEFLQRFKNFEESLEEITRLNELHGTKVFGPTKFTDWSADEFRRSMLSGFRLGKCLPQHGNCKLKRFRHAKVNARTMPVFGEVPEKFDWREKGVVFPVLDQRRCNACWAFSIVGVMESRAAISGAGKTRRSIQEVIDCSEYNHGCFKGDIRSALDYLCFQHYPVLTEKQYPFTLKDETCRLPNHTKVKGLRIREFWNTCNARDKISTDNDIIREIATHGPVVAAVNALPWRNYINGVIKTACESEWVLMNHVVQIVGYDLTAPVPYYIIRNSMGITFGDQGYVKVAIGDNVCGIANNIAYFTVA